MTLSLDPAALAQNANLVRLNPGLVEPAEKPKRERRAVETEAEFQKRVIALAHYLGWTVAAFRPARTEKGWRTPVQADGAGWPDLTLCRPPRLIFRELKVGKGRLSDAQADWHDQLTRCGRDVAVWRPEMWDEIVRELE